MSTLLAIAVCCMTGIAAMQMLKPVVDFIYGIQVLAHIDGTIIQTLLQIVGVGLVAELIAMICADAGSTSLGKSIQLIAASVILYQAIPILESMIGLIQEILGGI